MRFKIIAMHAAGVSTYTSDNRDEAQRLHDALASNGNRSSLNGKENRFCCIYEHDPSSGIEMVAWHHMVDTRPARLQIANNI